MVCPSCQEDFEPEVTHCPYCGAPTGVVPPKGCVTESDDLGPLIPIHEAWTEDELSRATEALAFEGIPFLIALTVWIMLGIVVLFVLSLPLLPLILTHHQIAWKRRHRRANRLEINSTELRAMRGAEVLAAYPWKHLKAIDTGGMKFDPGDGAAVWVPFPCERIPTFFRTVARFVLRGTIKRETARPVISAKVYFLGLGTIVGAASLKAAIDHWLARSGCAFPEDRQIAGWALIFFVVLVYCSPFVVSRLRLHGSPRTRRMLRRVAGAAN